MLRSWRLWNATQVRRRFVAKVLDFFLAFSYSLMRVLSRMFATGSQVLSSALKPRHSTRNSRVFPRPRESKIRAASWTSPLRPAGCLAGGFDLRCLLGAFRTYAEMSRWPSACRNWRVLFGLCWLRTCEEKTKNVHVNFKALTTVHI